MRPPIFIWDPGDLAIFRRAEDVGGFLEAIDVLNGVYTEAYDSEGRKLQLSIEQDKLRWWARWAAQDRIVVTVAEEEPQHANELRAVLLQALEPHHATAELTGLPLPDLVNMAVVALGYR